MSGALPLFLLLFFGWVGRVIGSGEGMLRRDVPRVELVAGSGSGELPRLARRGNASVEYLRYATQ